MAREVVQLLRSKAGSKPRKFALAHTHTQARARALKQMFRALLPSSIQTTCPTHLNIPDLVIFSIR